ncbi:MAG: globin [Roseibacillus sp.]|jgi:hemoglobin
MDEAAIWSELGPRGFRLLVAAFYRRIPGDELLGPMYPSEDLGGSEDRLYDFLCFRFGGVPRYLEERGHPRLRMRHRPFRIGEVERDRWLELMGAAMVEAEVPPPVAAPLGEFFAQVADFMRNT